MTTWVLSECGTKHLPWNYPRPRTGGPTSPFAVLTVKFGAFPSGKARAARIYVRPGTRKWALNVSSPVRLPSLGEKDEGERVTGVYGVVESVGGGDHPEFDPGEPPPFRLADIRAAIPKHCWMKDPWRSTSYVVRDVVGVFGMAAAAAYFNNLAVWPLYWIAQGTMFWAFFVLGHDCGHGSFSNNPKLNSVIGHLLHSSILVPYHGWSVFSFSGTITLLIGSQQSYTEGIACSITGASGFVNAAGELATEHTTRIMYMSRMMNHGTQRLPEKTFKSLDSVTKLLRFTLPFPMFAYPVYLWGRSPGKKDSHFDPSSDLFVPNERKDVLTSTACWVAMAALLVYLSFSMGPVPLLKLYGVPYLLFVSWLDLVTYLHHHGHEEKLPWYRGQEWSYLRGGLTTLDRDYGWINNIHHDIGTHVIHHLFPQISHYHLIQATEATKPVLGKYYREPKKSGPFPFHLLNVLRKSMKEDHYVNNSGDIVYYQTDTQLSK